MDGLFNLSQIEEQSSPHSQKPLMLPCLPESTSCPHTRLPQENLKLTGDIRAHLPPLRLRTAGITVCVCLSCSRK